MCCWTLSTLWEKPGSKSCLQKEERGWIRSMASIEKIWLKTSRSWMRFIEFQRKKKLKNSIESVKPLRSIIIKRLWMMSFKAKKLWTESIQLLEFLVQNKWSKSLWKWMPKRELKSKKLKVKGTLKLRCLKMLIRLIQELEEPKLSLILDFQMLLKLLKLLNLMLSWK